MKTVYFLFALIGCFYTSSYTQDFKKPVSDDEIQYLTQAFATMQEADQRYRSYLTYETLDDQLIAKIDSLMEADGIEAGFAYVHSLNLSLPEASKDSIHELQHQLDFQNHLMMRGIWEIYGYIPEELVSEHNYIQLLLLVHPQKNWDIPSYHTAYAELLLPEVKAGRMPAKTYALFYDNILGKILRKPQLYGTNEMYSREQGKVLPPLIGDLEEANQAREELGLPQLKEGEYRLSD